MSSMRDLAQRCEAIVGAAGIAAGEALPSYRIGEATPLAAVRPAEEADVSRILSLAWHDGLAVIPWGTGLHQSLGRPPERYDIALDLTRLNRVVDHQPGDMTVTAQAGIPLRTLQDRLARHGQFLPLDPPRGDRATLGGLLSTGLAGPLRCRYGAPRDLVLGLRIVHADGAVTKGGGRVVKNASAYDMPRLYLGALGTLGVIAEATLRVYPRAQAESGAVFAFPDVSAAQSVADRILRSALAPTRLEIGAGATGLPACENGAAALAATFSGVPESVASQGTAVIEMAAAQGGVPVGLADLAGFLRGWQDFPWAEAPDGGLRALWRGGVLPSECGKAMEAVHHAAGEDCRAGTLATVSAGLLRGVLSAGEPGRLARCLQAARRALENLGGYLVVLDAPAPVGAPVDVWGAPPPSFSLMRDLRQAFDERGVLNPGRFLGL